MRLDLPTAFPDDEGDERCCGSDSGRDVGKEFRKMEGGGGDKQEIYDMITARIKMDMGVY